MADATEPTGASIIPAQKNKLCGNGVLVVTGFAPSRRAEPRHHTTLPARRRNNSVHAQIFHHLPVVIEAMQGEQGCQSHSRRLAFAEWTLDLSRSIFGGDRSHRSEEHTSELQSLRH